MWVYRIRVLADVAAAHSDDIGRVKSLVHGVGLACIHDEQNLIVSALLMHLLKGIGDVGRGDLVRVLEL